MEPSQVGGDEDADASRWYNTSHDASANLSLFPFYNTTFIDEYYETLFDVPTGLIVLLSFFYGSISVLAVVGNFLIMWIVATSRRMQNVTNCYIANLALADIVIGLFAIPFQFQAALLQRWALPYFMCAFCPFVQALSVNVSVFTLTAIAVDRHRAILTPLSARPSKKIAKCIICCIWIMALSLATPMAMSWQVIMVEDRDPVTKVDYKKPFCVPSEFGSNSLNIYRLALFLLQYLTPLCIISCAYARMAFKLWGSKAPGNAQDSRDANIMKNKKKVIKMLVIVVALFALCWMPLQTYYLLQSYFPSINEYKYINIMFFCFDWLAMSNSCYNPFIYGIYNEKFKREFRQRFSFCRRHRGKGFGTDSVDIDRNQSFHTRLSSFRSTCDSRRHSTRLHQINQNLQPRCSLRAGSAVLCFNQANDDFIAPPKSRRRANSAKPEMNGETSLKFRNTKPDCKFLIKDLDEEFNARQKGVEVDCREDERVTELYIFPNSNIIEIKDVQEMKL